MVDKIFLWINSGLLNSILWFCLLGGLVSLSIYLIGKKDSPIWVVLPLTGIGIHTYTTLEGLLRHKGLSGTWVEIIPVLVGVVSILVPFVFSPRKEQVKEDPE